MREYSGENLFLGCIKGYNEVVIGKIGKLYNNDYFSMFLRISDTSCFDLSNNRLYVGEESLKIKILKHLNKNKMIKEKRLNKILEAGLRSL